MCTAITYKTKNHYFGRTFDYEFSYGEEVVITPRNYEFTFRRLKSLSHHYALIGMATVVADIPLYYEATNEKGLSMAGLNFPGNTDYKPEATDKDNVAPFEFIPWILGQCADIVEAKALLGRMNLANIHFSEVLPATPLHWIIADRNEAITVEAVKEGLKVYENPVGALTNNPPFDMQMFNLNNYMHLTTKAPENTFSDKLHLETYSRGMGALGMPGDLSSASRFVKVVFTKMNAKSGESEAESVSQFFHILGSVEQQRGCVDMGEGKYEITIYTSCCNTDQGIYYYTTYDNHQISAVHMHHENLDGEKIYRYALIQEEQIREQN